MKNRFMKLKKIKPKIKGKIMVIGVIIPLISLVIILWISMDTVYYLDDNARELSERLGNTAKENLRKSREDTRRSIDNNTDALLKYILYFAQEQVRKTEQLAREIEAEVKIFSQLAVLKMSGPGTAADVTLPSYSTDEHPGDIYSASVYALAPGYDPDKAKQDLNRSAVLDVNLKNQFKPLIDKDEDITIMIAFASGLYRRYPWWGELKAEYDPRKRPWYTLTEEEQNRVETRWIGPYLGALSGKLLVTCANALYNKDSFMGVVGADLCIDLIDRKTLGTALGVYSIAILRLVEQIFTLLLDSTGQIISPRDLPAEHWQLLGLTGEPNLLKSQNEEVRNIAAAFGENNTAIRSWQKGEEAVHIAYCPLRFQKDGNTLSLAFVLPAKKLMEPLVKIEASLAEVEKETAGTIAKIEDEKYRLIIYLVIMFALIALIMILLSLLLSKRIIGPLMQLAKGAAVLGSGEFDHRINLETGDELEVMSGAFNRMAQNLKTHIENLARATAARERIESELKVAKQIQASMLPRIFPPFPDRKEIDIYALMDPAREVGGDFYDFFFVTPDKLFFLIADVTGKGIAASLFMAIAKTLIKTEAMRGIRPREVLKNVNKIIIPDNDESMFVTVFCALLDVKTGELQYGVAGHNPPLLCRRGDGEDFQYLKLGKSFVLGVMEGVNFATDTFILKPGDALFLYSDGVTEAMNMQEHLFSEKRLQQSLGTLRDKNAEGITLGIQKSVAEFVQGAPQSDDLTILVLRYNG